MLIDLILLILTVRLFHSFIHYGKKDFLNDFILEGKGLKPNSSQTFSLEVPFIAPVIARQARIEFFLFCLENFHY